MTDTPDALLDALEKDLVDMFQRAPFLAKGVAENFRQIRARLTAGDAAIKRVADTDLALAERLRALADMRARAERAETDLAAARAEIERLECAIGDALEHFGAHDDYAGGMRILKAALAPKENANG